VNIGDASLRAAGFDVRTFTVLRLQGDLGLEDLSRDMAHLLEDRQGSRRDAVKVGRLQDVLNETFVPSQELLYDEVVVHGVPPDEKM
jgi:hypothetical protein